MTVCPAGSTVSEPLSSEQADSMVNDSTSSADSMCDRYAFIGNAVYGKEKDGTTLYASDCSLFHTLTVINNINNSKNRSRCFMPGFIIRATPVLSVSMIVCGPTRSGSCHGTVR